MFGIVLTSVNKYLIGQIRSKTRLRLIPDTLDSTVIVTLGLVHCILFRANRLITACFVQYLAPT